MELQKLSPGNDLYFLDSFYCAVHLDNLQDCKVRFKSNSIHKNIDEE